MRGSGDSARLHGLDTLRAAAIGLVMVYHLNMQGLVPGVMEPVARVGWVGVDLFFVLSGFLIGSQLMKAYARGKRPSLREFYARRAYRILPAFGVTLLLYMTVPLWREAAGPYAWWQYASFTWNLLLLGYPEHRAFSHVWSLCVEEHFYLVFPVLLMAMMRRAAAWRTVAAIVALMVGGMMLRAWLLYRVVLPMEGEEGLRMMKYLYYPTYTRLDGLTVGVGLAALRTFRLGWWQGVTQYGGWLSAAGAGFVAAGLWMCGFDYPSPDRMLSVVASFPMLAVGFGLLTASAVSKRGWLRLRVPGAGAVAALAYSLYLTHKSVAHAMHLLLARQTAAAAGWGSLAMECVACVMVAAALYWGVERPFLALRAGRVRVDAVETKVRLDPAI